MNSLIELSLNKIEKESLENFEVGSYEDVVLSSKENPGNDFLNHLAILANYESESFKIVATEITGESILKKLVLSYFYFYRLNYKSAFKEFKEYLAIENRPLSNTIMNFGIKVGMNSDNYDYALNLINKQNEINHTENLFIKLKVECLYNLKRHGDLIEYFKKVNRYLEIDFEVYLKVGLSLNALSRYKEAEAILTKIPLKQSLPSYEEKKKEYLKSFKEYESKADSLNERQLKDLGFAYLFNADYKKAEEVFSKVFISQE